MLYAIDDYGLTAQQLEDKYQKLDYHFNYRRLDYINSGVTIPYWDWVKIQLEAEEDQLQRSNPYWQV